MMKIIPQALVIAGVFAAIPAAAQSPQPATASCSAQGGPAIRVSVVGLQDRAGRLKLELYPATEGDFLKDDRDLVKEHKDFARVWSQTPQSGAVNLCIRAQRAGRFAIFFTHDRDGKNKFNIWKDGVGVVSGQKIGRSRPKVGQAIVNVPATGTSITIRAQYVSGLAGFSPVK
jgi:uncharacterized protein (DUF2141 family)